MHYLFYIISAFEHGFIVPYKLLLVMIIIIIIIIIIMRWVFCILTKPVTFNNNAMFNCGFSYELIFLKRYIGWRTTIKHLLTFDFHMFACLLRFVDNLIINVPFT